jgi:mannose-6-phosphate isomerase-like protein (cupin superfamily)
MPATNQTSSHSPINLQAKLSQFSEHWSPKIVANYNGNDILVVKVKGEFIWHSHPETDDFFHVLQGNLRIDLRDAEGNLSHVDLAPGEIYIVPRGVEHRPVAVDEVHLLLVEPAGTPNTGDHATAAVKQHI